MNHIAMLLPDLEVGGAQRVMILLAKEFTARGYKVDMVVLSASGPLRNSIHSRIELVDLATRNYGFGQIGFLFFSVFRLAAWMRGKKPDVLLSTVTGANLVALLAQKRAAVSTRIVIREAVTLKNVSSTLRLYAMRWLYPQADAVIALSPVMVAELSEKIGVPSSRIHYIANPVDAEFINEQGRMSIEHHWLDNEQFKVIISVGRLILQKDYATLLHAFALLSRKIPARLIILGEGAERANLEQLAVHLGVADITQFVGFDSNPWRWMAAADLFVLSSRWEGHPNALLEAIALGIPAIVTNYDGYDREMAEHYNISVVNVGDKIMLADKIEQRLFNDAPRDRIRLTINLDNIIDAYLRVLDKNLAHHNFSQPDNVI